MKSKRIRSAIVIPATTNLNRGDQALAWKAVELAKSCGFESVAVFTDNLSAGGQKWSKGNKEAGDYKVISPLILLPRHGKFLEDRGFHDSLLNKLLLATRGIADSIMILWTLLTAPLPKLCMCLLGYSQRNTLKAILDSDVVFVKGGGFIHSYKGLRWTYYLLYQLFHIMLALRMGKRVVVLPNSYGPFHSPFSKKLVNLVFKRCTLVTAREHVSARIMGDLLGKRISVFPDMAFGLKPASKEWAKAELISRGVPLEKGPCLGITVRPWRFPECTRPRQAFSQYLYSLEHLIKIAGQSGFYPVVFAHSLGPSRHEDDRTAINELVKRLTGTKEISILDSASYEAQDLMALYGEMAIMLATRFHSVIFSAVMGVPSIAIAYGGNKAIGIMSDMGISDYVVRIEDITPQNIERLFNKLLLNIEDVRRKINDYVFKSTRKLDMLVELVRRNLDDF